MQQRIMIAMALLCKPRLMIADEPTTALDTTIQAQILDLLQNVQKNSKMSLIFITHNLGVVAKICKRVLVMYLGKILEQGTTEEIFYQPLHPYTIDLLQSTPNLESRQQKRLHYIEGTPASVINPQNGCPFGPRCKYCMKICLSQNPPIVAISSTHYVSCWLITKKKGLPTYENQI
jgi:oligopeptide transport system ATP-binding protein